MGNQQGKGTSVAILKDPNYKVFDQKDYNKFYQDPDHIMCSLYDNFDEFIQKQSLKNLHHIIIIQEHKQFIQKYTKIHEQKLELVQYIRPIDNLINGKNQAQIRNRDKVINYIKKYSLDNINLYIYVKEFKSFIIPEYQVPYVRLVSTTSQMIINHILNQTTQNMATIKFKSLVKDLYRKKLVVVISKYCAQMDKPNDSKKSNKKVPQQQINENQKQKSLRIRQILKRMQDNFKSQQNNFQYLFVSSVQQLSQKLKSMYFQFMICVDQQDLLEIIEFKKKMPIESKLIFYGTKKDLGQQQSQNNIDKLILQKKKKQIWWVSNDLQNDISPVIRKWWNAKTQSSKNSKMAKNVIILVTKCQNIIQKKYIKQQLEKKLKTKIFNKQSQTTNYKSININIQHKIQNIYKKLRNDLYTIVILFDFSYQQFQKTKKIIMSKLKGQPRVQLSLVQIKKQKQTNGVKKSYKQLLDKRIQECSNNKYFEFKQQVSPIQCINCLNLTQDEHQYFSHKAGLQVNVLQPIYNYQKSNQLSSQQKQKKLYKVLQNYFPKITTKKVTQNDHSMIQNLGKNQKQYLQEIQQFELWSTFENFYIVCSFDDYLKYLFPYLVLAHLYDKKQHVFQLPCYEHIEQINNYLNRIKIIIFCEVEYGQFDTQNKIGLKQLLRIHQNPAQAQRYIKKAIHEFLQISDISNIITDLFTGKRQKETKHKQLSKQQLQQLQRNQLQQKRHKQKQQESLKRLFQHIQSTINKPYFTNYSNQLISNLMGGEKKTQIVFPNVEFIHFKLSQIQSYLKLCKYNKLSFSFFPKGSLKEFHLANKQIENIISSKSFVIDANYGSNNDQLKKIFQKNVQVPSTYRMQFVKTSKIIEQNKLQDFIKKYSGMWKLPFDVMNKNSLRPQYWQFNQDSLQFLKQGIIRAFKRSKNYQLLKVSGDEFKTFYIERIQSCKNLLDLQIACIYIYSLPHGMSDIVGAIFEQNSRSSLSLQIFIEFLFVLFLNFFSFHSRKLQKVQTVIYGDEKQMKNFYYFLKVDEIVFNRNMLHLMDNKNVTENERNHCIVIEYENMPYMKKSSLSAMLQVQELSFYKQSAEYLLAPFTKLRLKQKQIVTNNYRLYFEVVDDNQSNLFLKSFFQLNNINDIGIFQALDGQYCKINKNKNKRKFKDTIDNQLEEDIVSYNNNKIPKSNRNQNKQIQAYNQLRTSKKKAKAKSNNLKINQSEKSSQQKQFTSLYRRAQQIGLSEQKKNVQFSIRLNISFMKMLRCINKNSLFTAEKYLQLLYRTSESEMTENQKKEMKRFQIVKQATELKKLSIYQAMIYAKRHQFNKAINELNQLLQFMRLEKTQDPGNWIKIKILQLREEIMKVRRQRHLLIQSIEQQNRMESQKYQDGPIIHKQQHKTNGTQEDKLAQFNSLMRLQRQFNNNNNNNNKQVQNEINQQQQLQLKQQSADTKTNNYYEKRKKPTSRTKWRVSLSMQKQTFIITKIMNKKNQWNKQINHHQHHQQHHQQQQSQIQLFNQQSLNRQQQVYDLYCRKLFENNKNVETQQFITNYNQLISTLHIRDGVEGDKQQQGIIRGEDLQFVQQQQHQQLGSQQLLLINVSKFIIRQFFTQIKAQQSNVILLQLLHVFIIFRQKILNIAENEQQQQLLQFVQQHDNQKRRQQLLHNGISAYYILGKFKLWVGSRYGQFEEQLKRQQQQQSVVVVANKKLVQQFIDYLKSSLQQQQSQQKDQNLLLLSTYRRQLLATNNNNKRFNNNNNLNNTGKQINQSSSEDITNNNNTQSWIDKQIIAMNPLNHTVKWSVFEYQNKMILVDANRKWKQKISPNKGRNKKYSERVFYREDNEVIMNNEKVKRQQRNQ